MMTRMLNTAVLEMVLSADRYSLVNTLYRVPHEHWGLLTQVAPSDWRGERHYLYLVEGYGGVERGGVRVRVDN